MQDLTVSKSLYLSHLLLQILHTMYKLRKIFTALKINIMTEALKLMSGDPFDVRRGPNLKMQFKHAI